VVEALVITEPAPIETKPRLAHLFPPGVSGNPSLALLTTALSLGCGSSGDQTPTTPSGFPSLTLNNWTVMTTGAFAGLGLNYSFCGSITPQPAGQIGPGVRLVSREVTVFGADGQAYFTWVDRILAESPRDIIGGTGGCFGSMSDPVVGRPVASTFVGKVGYTSGGRTGVAEFSGPVVRIP
jgi:hypothetical protein